MGNNGQIGHVGQNSNPQTGLVT